MIVAIVHHLLPIVGMVLVTMVNLVPLVLVIVAHVLVHLVHQDRVSFVVWKMNQKRTLKSGNCSCVRMYAEMLFVRVANLVLRVLTIVVLVPLRIGVGMAPVTTENPVVLVLAIADPVLQYIGVATTLVTMGKHAIAVLVIVAHVRIVGTDLVTIGRPVKHVGKIVGHVVNQTVIQNVTK